MVAPQKFQGTNPRPEVKIFQVIHDGPGRGHRRGRLPGLDDAGASRLHLLTEEVVQAVSCGILQNTWGKPWGKHGKTEKHLGGFHGFLDGNSPANIFGFAQQNPGFCEQKMLALRCTVYDPKGIFYSCGSRSWGTNYAGFWIINLCFFYCLCKWVLKQHLNGAAKPTILGMKCK